MGKCQKCDGNHTVWERDQLGTFMCRPCPDCNQNGEAMRQQQDELDELYRQIKDGSAFSGKAVATHA